jgi:uncharacterized protein
MATRANPVGWFEIPVRDMTRAVAFYESVFEISLTLNEMGPHKMAWFPLERGAAGAPGTLVLGPGFEPSRTGTLVYLRVDRIDPTLDAIARSGGRTLLPRTSIGEYGFIAHFEDPEGNRVALHEAP